MRRFGAAYRALSWIALAASIAASAVAQDSSTVNTIGMEFVLIHPGTMTVGWFRPPFPQPPAKGGPAPYTADEYARIERAARASWTAGFPVTLAREYYIGKYEVTQAQWTRVMGTNPSIFQGDKVADAADRHPVDNVTWTDAQRFVQRLNALEKTTAYRLATEFEWEYAARAGATDDIPWSAIREQAIAGYNSYTSTHAVGEKKPNAWGLYDTLGNVWEWVQDCYNEKIFADPVPPKSGLEHVLKGGGFAADVKNATYLTHAAGPGSRFDVGFRVVKDTQSR